MLKLKHKDDMISNIVKNEPVVSVPDVNIFELESLSRKTCLTLGQSSKLHVAYPAVSRSLRETGPKCRLTQKMSFPEANSVALDCLFNSSDSFN